MVGLCVVVPALVIAATVDTTTGGIWGELGLIASPVAFFAHGERWSVPVWLCGVAALYVFGSAALCLLMVFFVASVGAAIVLGLLVASLAGALALIGCIRSRDPSWALVVVELIAAVGIGGALALIGSDWEALHHVEGGAGTDQTVTDLSGLFTFWAAAAVLILIGVAVAVLELRREPAITANE
jgi:hypothetical protein